MIEEGIDSKKYTQLIILTIYEKIQEFRSLNHNKRPTKLKIGDKEYQLLRKLNLDWKLKNDNPTVIMGFQIEKVDELDINQIEVK